MNETFCLWGREKAWEKMPAVLDRCEKHIKDGRLRDKWDEKKPISAVNPLPTTELKFHVVLQFIFPVFFFFTHAMSRQSDRKFCGDQLGTLSEKTF